LSTIHHLPTRRSSDLAIRAALDARREKRHIILVPESAHGTNPATAALCGFRVQSIKSTPDGQVDLSSLKQALTSDVAALMLTNPDRKSTRLNSSHVAI